MRKQTLHTLPSCFKQASLAILLSSSLNLFAADIQIDIPAQPLDKALNILAKQSGERIVFSTDLTEKISAPAVKGNLSPKLALEKLLTGSGLMLKPTEGGGYTVIKLPPPQTEPEVLPEVEVSANTVDIINSKTAAEVDDGIPFISTEINSLAIDLDIQKTPATINTVTEDMWAATGARTIDDVMQFIPGINLTDNGGGTADTVLIRGFAATRYFRDGMRNIGQYGNTQRFIRDNIERIEVVKGPAGSEFGVVEPGGSVNFITKKPQKYFKAGFDVSYGENGYSSVGGDVTGALNEDGTVQARLVGGYQAPPEWRDGRPSDTYNYVINPSINWDYAKGSNLLFSYERNYQKSPQDRGVIYLEGAFPRGFAPRDWGFHQTSDKEQNEIDRFSLTNNHAFTDHLVLTTQVERQINDLSLRTFRNADSEPGGALYEADGLTWNGTSILPIFFSTWNTTEKANSAKSLLKYDFSVGETLHTVSGGVDYYRSKASGDYPFASVSNTINIFSPVNNQKPNFTSAPFLETDSTNIKETGLLLRWLGEWTDDFRTVFGFRRYDYEYQFVGFYGGPAFVNAYESKENSYRIATSYDLTSNHTIFIGVSDSYVPQAGNIADGSPIDPIHDVAIEAGVKTKLLNGKLFWTNSIYNTKRQNIVASDPNDPSFVIPLGDARIMGFESELTGKVTDYLNVRAGVSFTKSEILKNERPEFEGNHFSNTAKRQLTALASYQWNQIGLDKLTTDVGVVYIGKRYGNSGNTITLPSYTLVNLGASYALTPKSSVRFDVTNLFDETYYTGMQDGNSDGADQVMVGNRRNASITYSHNF